MKASVTKTQCMYNPSLPEKSYCKEMPTKSSETMMNKPEITSTKECEPEPSQEEITRIVKKMSQQVAYDIFQRDTEKDKVEMREDITTMFGYDDSDEDIFYDCEDEVLTVVNVNTQNENECKVSDNLLICTVDKNVNDHEQKGNKTQNVKVVPTTRLPEVQVGKDNLVHRAEQALAITMVREDRDRFRAERTGDNTGSNLMRGSHKPFDRGRHC